MKSNKILCISLLIIGAILSGETWARGERGGHGGGGFRGHSSSRGHSGLHGSGSFRGRSSQHGSGRASVHGRGLHRFGSSGRHGSVHRRGTYRGHGGRHRSGDYYRHHGSHGHSSYGFYFGVPLYGYPYYPYRPYRYSYPYAYPPAVVTVPSAPPVYIEQSKPVTRDYPAGFWYYCINPEGYYPYVKECPVGWQQVEPAASAPK